MTDTASNFEIILNWISLIGTPISFFIAVLTWINTRKIKKHVDSALDLYDLKQNLSKYESKCNEFIIFLSKEPLIFNQNKIMLIRLFFTEINQKYPTINSDIIDSNKNAIFLLSNNDIKDQLPIIKNDLIDALSLIKNTLHKEIRIWKTLLQILSKK